jgi:hypothetical protein
MNWGEILARVLGGLLAAVGTLFLAGSCWIGCCREQRKWRRSA